MLADSVDQLIDSMKRPGERGMITFEQDGVLNVLLNKEVSFNQLSVSLKNCSVSSPLEIKWFNCIVEDSELGDYF